MKFILPLVIACLTALPAYSNDELKVVLREEHEVGRKIVWRVEREKFKKSPVWKADGEPPLSISDALMLANKHIKTISPEIDYCVKHLSISVPVMLKEFNNKEPRYFYVIEIMPISDKLSLYQRAMKSRAIVILMDGSIINEEVIAHNITR